MRRDEVLLFQQWHRRDRDGVDKHTERPRRCKSRCRHAEMKSVAEVTEEGNRGTGYMEKEECDPRSRRDGTGKSEA